MRCRVVFPPVEHFSSLDAFLAYAGRAVSKPAEFPCARFFLFGEDMLGAIQRSNARILNKPLMPGDYSRLSIISHEQTLSFVSALRKSLSPKDFIIFSIFEHLGHAIFNSVYLVGRGQWFFDFKRNLSISDRLVLDEPQQALHRLSSLLNPRGAHCVRAGHACVRGLHLAVCADIYLLPKIRLARDSLVFLPASGLDDDCIFPVLQGLKGSGRVFINDPALGIAWDMPFGRGVKRKPVPLVRSGSRPLFVDFELN